MFLLWQQLSPVHPEATLFGVRASPGSPAAAQTDSQLLCALGTYVPFLCFSLLIKKGVGGWRWGGGKG